MWAAFSRNIGSGAQFQRVALATAAHMCKKLPSYVSDLVLPMYFFRLGNERILESSLNPLNPLKIFTSPVPALPRCMAKNVNSRLRMSCCPRCKDKYELELAKLVSEFENSSSEAKLESPLPQLPQWLQNDMLKNDSNVTSLSQVWFYMINGTENNLYCVQAEESYCFLMSLQIKDQGKFELDNLQRDSNEIANELCRLKEEMLIDLSLEDVKRVALHYGFVFEKESTIKTTYTTNSRSMLQIKIGVPTSDEIVVIDRQKALQQNSKGVTIASTATVSNPCNSIYCDVYTTIAKTVAIDLSQRPPMGRLLNRCDRPIATVLWPIATVLQPTP
ncbi:hypothetical protein CQW23_15408 [Capsicum baccatum]|uniref:Uncharacterized protein n=1 Tax=Capsicum baccatum TaxID=33114 RepID=A0A2G2WM59_CAPBA|nr:hypothetical protein CQW23_15408 [Capsicum baccatum]